jgi:hypothetical protein
MVRIRWWYVALAAWLVLAVAVVARQPPPPTAPAPQAAPPRAEEPTVMDAPLRLLAEARQAFKEVRDYSCLLIKRERIGGQLQADQVIGMKVRNQPFSVYLRWQEPRSMAGQESCYVVGRNDNMMRVHPTGLAGIAGWVSLDPRDPRVTAHSHHSITEAGIGNLLDRFGQRWEEERRLNQTQVHIAEYEYNKRPCTRVETMHPPGGPFLFYRTVLYFDKETHLPIRVENYDWPRQRGGQNGELVEVYSYVDLRLNVQLRDDEFYY